MEKQGLLNPIPLNKFGYDDRYTIYPCGKVYNSKSQAFCTLYNDNTYNLKTKSGKFRNVPLRTLYKLSYNKLYVRDNIENLDNERWLDISVIPKYSHLKGKYKISDMGRIKSYCHYDAILLIPQDNGKGYDRVCIDSHYVRVNRLVLMAFDPRPDYESLEADHLNFQTHDNKRTNLQWLDGTQNRARAWERRNKRKEENADSVCVV